MKIGFDHKKYIEEQSKYILERVNHHDKLYLEFGGKLIGDFHAKRVLPGFDEDAKIKLLYKLKEKVEIVICVYAGDIERNKIRGDYGITYDMDVLRLIDDLRAYELLVNSVVITRYNNQPSVTAFINKLERRGIKVYKHTNTKGYPTDVETIVSDEGYGENPYIETTKPIVIVTGPGAGSGKLSTCLSQMYHEYKAGRTSGYSKFETFPVWNIPLKHPLNIAYEAATADLRDANMIDSFHFDAYGTLAINYNRDIETFPVLQRIIEKITGEASVYKSPTDMGVNRVGFGIVDDKVVQDASNQEIIRRYFKTSCEYKKGQTEKDTFERVKLLMQQLDLKEADRKVVPVAREYLEGLKENYKDSEGLSVVSLELDSGEILTGKSSVVMDATAAVVLNAIKYLADISDSIHMISPVVLEPIKELKRKNLRNKTAALSCEEILIALSISAATNPTAQVAMDKLTELRNCRAHSTTILSLSNEETFRKLGIDITSDAEYATDNLYYND